MEFELLADVADSPTRPTSWLEFLIHPAELTAHLAAFRARKPVRPSADVLLSAFWGAGTAEAQKAAFRVCYAGRLSAAAVEKALGRKGAAEMAAAAEKEGRKGLVWKELEAVCGDKGAAAMRAVAEREQEMGERGEKEEAEEEEGEREAFCVRMWHLAGREFVREGRWREARQALQTEGDLRKRYGSRAEGKERFPLPDMMETTAYLKVLDKICSTKVEDVKGMMVDGVGGSNNGNNGDNKREYAMGRGCLVEWMKRGMWKPVGRCVELETVKQGLEVMKMNCDEDSQNVMVDLWRHRKGNIDERDIEEDKKRLEEVLDDKHKELLKVPVAVECPAVQTKPKEEEKEDVGESPPAAKRVKVDPASDSEREEGEKAEGSEEDPFQKVLQALPPDAVYLSESEERTLFVRAPSYASILSALSSISDDVLRSLCRLSAASLANQMCIQGARRVLSAAAASWTARNAPVESSAAAAVADNAETPDLFAASLLHSRDTFCFTREERGFSGACLGELAVQKGGLALCLVAGDRDLAGASAGARECRPSSLMLGAGVASALQAAGLGLRAAEVLGEAAECAGAGALCGRLAMIPSSAFANSSNIPSSKSPNLHSSTNELQKSDSEETMMEQNKDEHKQQEEEQKEQKEQKDKVKVMETWDCRGLREVARGELVGRVLVVGKARSLRGLRDVTSGGSG